MTVVCIMQSWKHLSEFLIAGGLGSCEKNVDSLSNCNEWQLGAENYENHNRSQWLIHWFIYYFYFLELGCLSLILNELRCDFRRFIHWYDVRDGCFWDCLR